jgi:hypothetical protein
MLDTVDVFGAISICVLGCTAAQATLIDVFVVTSEIVCQQNIGLECSVMRFRGHRVVGVLSFWLSETCTCMCSTNLLSNTHTLAYTLSKT